MIVDHRGKPIERRALAEQQTSRLGHLHREFQNHPSRGLTPARLAAILEDAEQGQLMAQHELFADMEEKDGHVMAEMAKRKRALLGVPWTIEPPPDANRAEQRAADAVREMLTELPDLEDVILEPPMPSGTASARRRSSGRGRASTGCRAMCTSGRRAGS